MALILRVSENVTAGFVSEQNICWQLPLFLAMRDLHPSLIHSDLGIVLCQCSVMCNPVGSLDETSLWFPRQDSLLWKFPIKHLVRLMRLSEYLELWLYQ